MERGKKIVSWIPFLFIPDRLVPGRAGITFFLPRHLPHNPVGRLHKFIGGRIHLRRFFGRFPNFGDEPLRGDFAAVPFQPLLAHLPRCFVQLVGLRLGSMVFPQLYPGIRVALPLRQETKRRAICLHRQHGTRCKIGANADHIIGADATFAQNLGHGRFQHFNVILRVLQGKIVG